MFASEINNAPAFYQQRIVVRFRIIVFAIPKFPEMMNSGLPIVVMNPYDWMPGYGENRVEIQSKGLDWEFKIFYDGVQFGEWVRDLIFHSVCGIYRESFPGVSFLDINLQSVELGQLMGFPKSEAATK